MTVTAGRQGQRLMPKAVQFGAGNIGRGFLGQLFFEGGYETTFVDADAALVSALNARGRYPLRLVSEAGTEHVTVGRLRALPARDTDAVARAVAEADLVSVAVGVSALPAVAPTLAAGLRARRAAGAGPVNVLLCENQWHVGTQVRELMLPHVAPDTWDDFDSQVGLVEAVIGRMVPTPTAALRAEDPLLIVAEPYQELPIARAGLRAPAPALPGLIVADNFEAFEAQKLYLHNMSHAALAYLGWQRQHEFIWQCAEDAHTADVCAEALTNVAAALEDLHSFSRKTLTQFNTNLMRRFANHALGDTVARVAADPLRKLRPKDRLVGAATLCLNSGQDFGASGRIIAAALTYDNPAEPAAVALQMRRRAEGDAVVLRDVCGITADSALASQVIDALKACGGAED